METEIEAPERIAPERALPSAPTKADVLERAADLFGEYGHIQGHLGSKADGYFCLVGAVNEAHYDLGFAGIGDPYKNFDEYKHLIGRDYEWNDALPENRAKDLVVYVLRRAARLARIWDARKEG